MRRSLRFVFLASGCLVGASTAWIGWSIQRPSEQIPGRSGRWLDRCFGGAVGRAAAHGDQGIAIRAREFAAVGLSLTLKRSCA